MLEQHASAICKGPEKNFVGRDDGFATQRSSLESRDTQEEEESSRFLTFLRRRDERGCEGGTNSTKSCQGYLIFRRKVFAEKYGKKNISF